MKNLCCLFFGDLPIQIMLFKYVISLTFNEFEPVELSFHRPLLYSIDDAA
jgi:hypothetical protein